MTPGMMKPSIASRTVPMILRIRLFAALRDKVGAEIVEVQLPDTSRVSDLRRALAHRFPELDPLLKRSAVAVAEEYANDDAILDPDQPVALIPPVSGGQ